MQTICLSGQCEESTGQATVPHVPGSALYAEHQSVSLRALHYNKGAPHQVQVLMTHKAQSNNRHSYSLQRPCKATISADLVTQCFCCCVRLAPTAGQIMEGHSTVGHEQQQGWQQEPELLVGRQAVHQQAPQHQCCQLKPAPCSSCCGYHQPTL